MPYSPNSCFAQFNRDVVNIDSTESATARASRDFLMGNITQLALQEKIPSLDPARHVFYGSFARKTKIRPLNDIDIMISYDCLNAKYSVIEPGKLYSISVPKGDGKLYELCDEGKLNSRKVLNNLRDSLSDRSKYSRAEMHRNQEAVTMQLVSRPWNFDLVPCFYAEAGFYLIPDGKGQWKPTNPIIDQENVTSANLRFSGQLLQLIRTMKYWKRLKANSCLSSYAFELLLIQFSRQYVYQSFPRAIHDALNYVANNAYTMILNDPKGFQGNLNTGWISDEGKRLSDRAQADAFMATLALAAEYRGNNRDAISNWRCVFGEEFPEYGA